MIKDINKRFIASGVAFILLPSIFLGCNTSNGLYNEKDSRKEQPDDSDYDFLSNCYYIEINNSETKQSDCYITNRNEFQDGGKTGYIYRDILSSEDVYVRNKNNYDYFYWTPNETKRQFVNEIKIEDYLYSMNLIKNEYTQDDIKYILDEMSKINDEKKLVKE